MDRSFTGRQAHHPRVLAGEASPLVEESQEVAGLLRHRCNSLYFLKIVVLAAFEPLLLFKYLSPTHVCGSSRPTSIIFFSVFSWLGQRPGLEDWLVSAGGWTDR